MSTLLARMLGVFGTFLIFSAANAQTDKLLHGCEPPRELRIAMRKQLDPKKFEGMKTYERMARRVEIIQALMEKFPREAYPAHDLIWYAWYGDVALLPALQQRFEAREKVNPNDPMAVYWSGYSRFWDDAPEAIRRFKRARELAPSFPWPYLGLAGLYARGKTRDAKALSENLEAFFTFCPSSTDAEAQRWLTAEGNHDRMAKVAAAIRARFRDETDPDVLQSYETLWALEFQVSSPTEHEAVRQRISDDLKRLETLVPAPDAEFQNFLIHGYKQSAASAETIRAKEDRLLRQFPKSKEAHEVTENRWDSAHKEPADQSDTAAWERYDQQHRDAVKGWIQQFKDDYYLSHYGWKELVDRDGVLTEKEVLAIFQSDMREAEEAEYLSSFGLARAAHFLLQRKVQPELAMATLEKVRNLQDQERRRDAKDTNRGEDAIAATKANLEAGDRYIVSEMLTAARQLKRPELTEKLRTEITAPAADSWFVWLYWTCRARLAVLDGHNTDALAYFQLANQTIPRKPQMLRGKFWDDQGEETKALWKEMGGTDEAWQVWRKQPATSEQAADLWMKPNQQLPDFALSDMAGKTWHLKDLSGHTTLINVWATWCGACQAELPHVEKLFQMIKERKDIQVVTFNVDQNPGLVPPYLKEHQYKFPVLLAHSFVNSTLDRSGIPQNWIIDPRGKWVSTAPGFGLENDWEGNIARRLEAVHTNSETESSAVAAQK